MGGDCDRQAAPREAARIRQDRNASGGAGPERSEGPACGTPGRGQKGAPRTRRSPGPGPNNAADGEPAASACRSLGLRPAPWDRDRRPESVSGPAELGEPASLAQ